MADLQDSHEQPDLAPPGPARRRGRRLLRRLVAALPQPTIAVLGNHDLAISRDPQARRSDLRLLQRMKSLIHTC